MICNKNTVYSVDVIFMRILHNYIVIHILFGGYYIMNLHEQCLLRYLKNPDELSCTTEILKLNNFILENRFLVKNFVAKSSSIHYNNNVN